MTLTVIDDFAGANGLAVSAAKWNRLYQTGGSGALQGGKARLRLASTATDNYLKASLESVATYGRGRYRADVTLGRASAGGLPNMVTLGFCGTNPYDAPYTNTPITGYAIEVLTGGTVRLLKIQDEQLRDVAGTATGLPLSTATISPLALGDVLHLEGEPLATGLEIRVWRNAEARPSAATLSSTDTTYAGGEVKLSTQGSDPGTDVWGDWAPPTYDDLATATTTASAGVDQAVAPNATVVLIGAPPKGSDNNPGAWSQVSGPAQQLGAPVTSATDTRVSFVAKNMITSPVACTFRYTVA